MNRLSIRHRILLATFAVLLTVISVYAIAAYHEVRRSAMLVASERLQSVTRQFGDLLAASAKQRLDETRALGGDSALRSHLRHPTARSRAAAMAALQRFVTTPRAIAAVDLLDRSGRRVLTTHETFPPLQASAVLALLDTAPAAGHAVVGAIQVSGDSLSFPVIAGVADGAENVGFVVQHRRLATSAESRRQLTDLIGSGARLYLGNARGDVWTDLIRVTDKPPVDLRGARGIVQYRRPDSDGQLAAATAVGGTPWVLLLEFPRSVVLSRAQVMLRWFAALAAVVLGLGSVAAWGLSRGLTRPLVELATAAEAISTGDLARRVSADRDDELGTVARAFNGMAQSVAEGQRQLHDQVAQLRVRERQLSSIYDTAGDVLFQLAVEEDGGFRFVSVNQTFVTVTGIAFEHVVGKRLEEVIPRPSLPQVLEKYATAIREKRTVRWEETSAYPAGTLTGEVSVAPLLDDAGKCTSLVGAVHDITERKRAEEALRRLNEELERRIAARTEELVVSNRELEAFSYSVSHDLRAPLRSIDGFSQALLEDHAAQLDEQGRQYLQRVRAATQRLAELIEDLLGLARVTRADVRRELVDLTAMARSVAQELSERDPGRAVDFRCGEGLVVSADPRLLRVLLANLLGNAWKFTSRQPRPKVELDTAADGGRRTYVVRDNGAGFDMAYGGKLFGTFQRLHSAAEFPGTGVGLATVQRIVVRHGGRVWAEGAVGQGASFYFTLEPR